jgi:hypothetical protein
MVSLFLSFELFRLFALANVVVVELLVFVCDDDFLMSLRNQHSLPLTYVAVDHHAVTCSTKPLGITIL